MTGPLTAPQLVYANVEADRSPRKKRGLQTLYHTRIEGLGPAEVLDLESRLSYEARGHVGHRHLFFPTKAGRFACVRFVPVEGLDRFNRKGLYFAHALLLDAETLLRLGNNPFVVFLSPGSAFRETLEETIEGGNFADGTIPPARLDPDNGPPSAVGLEAIFSEAAARWLVFAGLQAKKLRDNRRTIALHGDPKSVFDSLRILITSLPVEARSACSFDTFGSRQTADRSMLWAVGLNEPPAARPGLLPVTIGPSAPFKEGLPLSPETPFERWAAAELSRKGMASYAAGADTAWRIHVALRDREPSRLSEIDPEFGRAFVDANRPILEESVMKATRDLFGTKLPSWLSAKVRNWIANELDPVGQLDAWIEGPGASLLVAWIMDQLRKDARLPLGSETDQLLAAAATRSGKTSEGSDLEIVRAFDRGHHHKLVDRFRSVDWQSPDQATLLDLLLKRAGVALSLCTHQDSVGLTFACLGRFARTDAGRAFDLVAVLLGENPAHVGPAQSLGELDRGIRKIGPSHCIHWSARSIANAAKLPDVGWRFLPLYDGFLLGFYYQFLDPKLAFDHYILLHNLFKLPVIRDQLPDPALKSKAKRRRGEEAPSVDGELYSVGYREAESAFLALRHQIEMNL